MKDISTPVPPNEFKSVIKKLLESAALVHYERLSEEAKVKCMFSKYMNKHILII